MTSRDVRVRLSVENSQAIAGLKATGATAEQVAGQMSRAGASSAKHWDTIGKYSGRAFLAGAAGLAVMERANYKFDQSMSRVDAATHARVATLESLRTAAIKAGADSVFSASEAADAETELAKAGVKTRDILKGGLTGALNLASAGELGVAQSAEYMATALTQFQLPGTKATHVADLLAAGAGKAQGEVSDMALALNYAGVPAAQLGVSIEQTAGTIALLAKNGILGEKAGTGLRGILSSLTSPSAAASKEMKRLGIEVFDTKGNFIGLDGLAGQLHKRLSGLTQAERSNALGKIFGNAQLTAANVLYREGAKGVHTWTKNVNDSGYAADTAKRKLNNLAGDVEYLKGDLDSLFLQRGSGAQDGLRSFVQGIDKAVVGFSHLPDAVQSGVVKVIALGTATAGTLYVVSKLVKGYREVSGLFGAGKKLAAGATAASSLGVQKVYVVNMGPGGFTPGGGGKPGAPIVAGAPKGGGLAKAARGGLIALEVATAAALGVQIQEAVGQIGSRGKERGLLKAFDKPRSSAASLLAGGSSHTLENDLSRTLDAKKFDGFFSGIDQKLAKVFGGDSMTKSLKNVKGLDSALVKLNETKPGKALEEYQKILDKSGLSAAELAKALPKATAAIQDQTKGAKLLKSLGIDTAKYAENIKLLPAAVQKAVEGGNAITKGQIRTLSKQYDLTPIQVKALITLAGGPEAITEARKLAVKMAHELDVTVKPKPNTHQPTKGDVGGLLISPTLDTAKYKAVIGQARKELKNIPAAVMTRVSTPGALQSVQQIRALGRQYDLTPKQVRTLIKLVGTALAKAGLKGLSKDVTHLDRQKANPKISVDTAKARGELNSFAAYLNQLTRPRTVNVNVHVGKSGGVGDVLGQTTGADGLTVPGARQPYGDKTLVLAAPGEEIISNRHGQADQFRRDRASGRIPAYAAGGTVGAVTGGRSGDAVVVTFPAPAVYAAAVKAANEIAVSAAYTARSAAETRQANLADLGTQQRIRDLSRDLRRKETVEVTSHGKKHKVKRLAVRGLDRTIAQAELRDARAQLLEDRAQVANEAKQALADARTEAVKTLTDSADIFGRGVSPGSAIASVNRQISDIGTYGSVIARLKGAKASPALLAQIVAKANSGDFRSAIRLGQALLDQPALLGQLNASLATLGQVSGNVGALTTDPRFLSSGAWNPVSPATVSTKQATVLLGADPNSWMNELKRVVVHEVATQLSAVS